MAAGMWHSVYLSYIYCYSQSSQICAATESFFALLAVSLSVNPASAFFTALPAFPLLSLDMFCFPQTTHGHQRVLAKTVQRKDLHV
jgi:hypothetical protein